MFRNNLKIAWRNLWHNKTFSAINIIGLAIGISTCLIILLFVQHELSYDRFFPNSERIVRVEFKGSINGSEMKEASVFPPVAQTLVMEFPEIKDAARIRTGGSPLVSYGSKTIRENRLVHVDDSFFRLFSIPFISGNSKSALLEPNSLVINESMAKKYFGKEDPMGKLLTFKNWNAVYKVTGVIQDIPSNAHFHFDFFASMATIPEAKEQSWMSSSFFTYLLLPEDYDYKKLETKLPKIVDKYMGPQIQEAFGMSIDEFRKNGNNVGLFLQPLTDIHLFSDVKFDFEPAGDVRYVYIFSAVALFVLLIACINFMNLSTAGASKRAREVGVRKVLGGMKPALIRQFLVESIVIACIATLIAVLIVYIFLPNFNKFSGKELNFSLSSNPFLLPSLIAMVLIPGILGGAYPAFFLSAFKPVQVLKGDPISGKKTGIFRSGLVVFQFFVSIVLIVGSAIVYQQLKYIQSKALGYDKEQVLILHDTWTLGDREKTLQQQLEQDSRVASVSISGYLPAGATNYNNNSVFTEDDPDQFIKTLKYQVDHRYIPTLGMKILSGRNFSPGLASDSNAVIINQSAANAFGWGINALDHSITDFVNNHGMKMSYRIIGIVEDFHFVSLHQPITPLMMVLGGNSGSIIVKVKTEDASALLSSIKTQWSSHADEALFSYSFLDERFEETYKNEQKLGQLLGVFSGITIFVACLGLYGLVKYSADRRTKEIGIRKVLGASAYDMVSMLSKDFLKLILIANLLAWPVAWYIMNDWLTNFEYRITFSWWILVTAGILAIIIALVTIALQAIKAALANPVKSLRSE